MVAVDNAVAGHRAAGALGVQVPAKEGVPLADRVAYIIEQLAVILAVLDYLGGGIALREGEAVAVEGDGADTGIAPMGIELDSFAVGNSGVLDLSAVDGLCEPPQEVFGGVPAGLSGQLAIPAASDRVETYAADGALACGLRI